MATGSNKTPLIRPLRKNGATLYVFPSASEDIGLNINSNSNGVALSHYALLNFTKKNFKFSDVKALAKDLQNYAMNFETALINEPTYNYQETRTVTEGVFWHWIMKNQQNTADKFSMNEISGIDNVYRESKFRPTDQNRLVQCFGAIDAGNSLSTEFGMFNETYVNIPTSYGNGPVFFRRIGDNQNLRAGVSYPTTQSSDSFIQNRNNTDKGYLGSINAVYDDDSLKCYKSDDGYYEIVKDIPTIKNAIDTVGGAGYDVNITSFDSINIDHDRQFAGTVYDFTANNLKCEFNFNAILLYYSIYDMNDMYKQPIATNLFGVVFLDGGGEAVAVDNYIMNPYKKKKSYSSESTNDNSYFGNSFSFRINIKTLSVYDNTDAKIDDNTTMTSAYAQDFNDVVANLNRAIDVMNTNVHTTMAIQDKYIEIRQYYIEQKEKYELLKKEIE